MWIEQSQRQEIISDVYEQIRLSDDTPNELTLDEKTTLIQQYELERGDIQWETSAELHELHSVMDIFEESTNMSSLEIKKIQMIVWVPKWNARDWVFWPWSFDLFSSYKNETWFSGWLQELYTRYEEVKEYFNSLPRDERKDLQAEWWKDGVFGQGTFKHILINNLTHLNTSPVSWPLETSENIEEWERQGPEPLWEMQWPKMPEDLWEQPQELEMQWPDPLREMQGPEPLGEMQGPEMPDLNELWMTQEQMQEMREQLRGSEEYNEARVEARSLSRDEIKNIQAATGSDIDGGFGLNTYIHYKESDLASAGFSLSEVGKLEKVVNEWETEKLSQDIAEAYGIEVEDISEIFSEISPWDYFSYNTYFWRLTLFDSETSEKVTIDVAEGLFDTVENSFSDTPENAREKLSNTLSRISWERERGHYIDQILNYIDGNQSYEKARAILCEASDEWIYKLSLDDFGSRGKSDLILKIKAVHLYWDHDIVKKWDEVYFLDSTEYYWLNSGRRLSIWGNTEISIPSQEEKEEIIQEVEEQKRRAEITRAIEWDLHATINRWDTESILWYCEFASSWNKQKLLENMKAVVLEEKLFASIRIMFSRVEGNNFIFNSYSENEGVGDLFEKWLSAFELFGDYESIIVNGEEYSSWNTKRYGVSIYSGDAISWVGDQRTQEDYEKLTLRSDYNVRNMRRPQFMRNPQTWVTLCWATARVFANQIWAPGTPASTWYAFNQFRMMPEPKTWQVPNSVRSINQNYNMWLWEITRFLENSQTLVAQIYLDAAWDYGGNFYGHVATVVLDSSWEYYVFDAYQNGWVPMKLSDYYSTRRWQISAWTGQRKDFKWIAKLL